MIQAGIAWAQPGRFVRKGARGGAPERKGKGKGKSGGRGKGAVPRAVRGGDEGEAMRWIGERCGW